MNAHGGARGQDDLASRRSNADDEHGLADDLGLRGTQTRAQVVESPRNEALQGSRRGASRQLRCLCATLVNVPGTGRVFAARVNMKSISAARWFYSPEASDHWPLGRQLKSCISISLTTSESVARVIPRPTPNSIPSPLSP